MQDRNGGKGTKGTLLRLGLLPLRYGVTPARLQKRLRLMISSLNRVDIRPTVNVTACNLESVPAIVGDLREADLGIHGYQHVAYEALSAKDQAKDLDKAIETFGRFDLEVGEFRGPYLRINAETLALLAARHFQLDSSIPQISWLAGDSLLERVLEFSRTRYRHAAYGPLFPFQSEGLVEIPVTVPDDEILVDGLGITNTSTMKRVFESMLKQTMATGSLMVLQIHPERYDQCAEAVHWVLEKATAAGAWPACLSEIATWTKAQHGAVKSWPKGHPFAVAVTGDLDALCLGDFGSRFRLAIS